MSKKKSKIKETSSTQQQKLSYDNVNNPKHYTSHPSGVECIDIVRYYNFNVGNVIKYLWRHGLKHEQGMSDREKALEDLRKAQFYLNDEIAKASRAVTSCSSELPEMAKHISAMLDYADTLSQKHNSRIVKSSRKCSSLAGMVITFGDDVPQALVDAIRFFLFSIACKEKGKILCREITRK